MLRLFVHIVAGLVVGLLSWSLWLFLFGCMVIVVVCFAFLMVSHCCRGLLSLCCLIVVCRCGCGRRCFCWWCLVWGVFVSSVVAGAAAVLCVGLCVVAL